MKGLYYLRVLERLMGEGLWATQHIEFKVGCVLRHQDGF